VSAGEHFRAALRASGLDYAGEIIADGKLHRFKAGDDHNRNSWYVLHSGVPAAGAFGCWKQGVKGTWCEKRSQDYTDAEWRTIRENWKRADLERERIETERHAKARKVAAWILNRAKPVTTHDYLAAKGVKPFGDVREYRGALVVPLRDADGELHSLQFISADGTKRFLSGGRITGCFLTISDRTDGALVICEGYATGASVHEATCFAVVCAMNCGNLLAVSKSLRDKFPVREIVVAGDNDAWTDGNPGLTKATEAAKAIGACLAVPQFTDISQKLTDFNDLHQLQGADTVKTQIEYTTTPKETDPEAFDRLAKLSSADYDRCRKDEAKRLKIRPGTLDDEVARRRLASGSQTQSGVPRRRVEPWSEPVSGSDLLNDIVAFYEKFVVLSASVADVLAVWCLQSWCYELFDFAAIIAVWSPEHECGKGRVLDVTEKIVRCPFRTSNTSAPVLYHKISKGELTVLVDELDSIGEEQRAAICNILKGGFQSNGTAHRMTERNGEQVEVEFSTYCPKMIATITLDKLDKATRSRTIGIRMKRKPRSQKVAKFRRVDATILQRKCMRWAQDNAEAIKAVPPMDVDECATDRQEDVWEPLIAIARVAGGDWEKRIRLAAQHLAAGGSDGASETVAHQVLAAFQSYFSEHGDRTDTKTIIAALNESGDFADVNFGRGLTPHYVARLLKPYGIEPRVHKMNDGKTARGYSRDDCEQAFTTYLSDAPPKGAPVKCNSVTAFANIERNEVLDNVTKANGYTSESAIPTNKNADGNTVTLQKQLVEEFV